MVKLSLEPGWARKETRRSDYRKEGGMTGVGGMGEEMSPGVKV